MNADRTDPRKESKQMSSLTHSLLADECGFIVSAELVLVATIVVIGMVVGLSEVQHALVAELNDVGDAIGSLNQSYSYSGFSVRKHKGIKSQSAGSVFTDRQDDCDNNQCDLSCAPPTPEANKGGHGYR